MLRSRGKRRSFPLGRLLVVLGVVVLVFVFLSFFLARVGLAGDVPRSIAHEPQRDFVPAEFRGAVSMDEPGWVGLAQRNLAGAREQLQQHLGRWLSRAPVDGVRRQTVADWPQFRSIVAPSSARVDVVMAELQSLLAAEDYDETIAERLGGHGLWVLQLAADLLQDDGTPASLQNAQRLHRFLTETTGFQGIELYDDAGLTPLDRLGLNSGIGSLWSWFLHEVGSTQRSWDAYLGLQDG